MPLNPIVAERAWALWELAALLYLCQHAAIRGQPRKYAIYRAACQLPGRTPSAIACKIQALRWYEKGHWVLGRMVLR